MTLELIQHLADTSTRNHNEDKGRPAHKADNLTAFCEPII
jgi:hypothetical protein